MITKKDSLAITRLSSFSMLLILIMHNIITSNSFAGEVFYTYIFRTFTRTAVPIFFLISSYLLFNNYSVEKIRKRTKTLLLPFFIWSLISYCIFAFLPMIPGLGTYFNNQLDFTIGDFLKSIFVSPQNGSLWFLRDLYILTLLSPIIHYITNKRWIAYIIISFLLIVWCIDLEYTFLVESSLFFIVGALISKYDVSLTKYGQENKYVLPTYFFIITPLLSYFTINGNYNPMIITKVSIIIGLICLYLSINIFTRQNIIMRSLDNFKKYSFILFVTNSIIIAFTKKILIIICPPTNLLTAVILYIISFILLLFIGIILYYIIASISQKTLILLTGNRC